MSQLPNGVYRIECGHEFAREVPGKDFIVLEHFPPRLPKLAYWIIKHVSGPAYTIQNAVTRHYASDDRGRYVSLDDNPTEWFIEPSGTGHHHISVPNRDLLWTCEFYRPLREVVFTLRGADGSPQQQITLHQVGAEEDLNREGFGKKTK